MKLALAGAAVLLALTPTAAAHLAAPPGVGDSWQNATDLGFTPGHSYGAIQPGGGYHYYTIQLVRGETARIRLVAPAGSFEQGFPPYLVLAGPSANASGYQPALAVPPGDAMDTRAGARPGTPGGDPLVPTSFRTLVDARIDVARDERWYFIVDSPEQGGSFAVFADPPASGLSYAWNVPTERIEAYRWQGTPNAELWGVPIAAGTVTAAGVWLAWRRGHEGTGAVTSLAALAAVLLAASTGSLLDAALRASAPLFTWSLVLAGVLASAGAVALAVRPSTHARWLALALGMGALVSASGFLLAPVSLILGAILPRERRAPP